MGMSLQRKNYELLTQLLGHEPAELGQARGMGGMPGKGKAAISPSLGFADFFVEITQFAEDNKRVALRMDVLCDGNEKVAVPHHYTGPDGHVVVTHQGTNHDAQHMLDFDLHRWAKAWAYWANKERESRSQESRLRAIEGRLGRIEDFFNPTGRDS